MKFEKMHLSKNILSAIKTMGYEDATPIQELAIPQILDKKDIIGLAQTGTGKTAAFALPIIDTMLREYKSDRKIKALILTPTRELAIQIRDNVLMYIKNTNFKCSVVLGGVNINSQIRVLKNGVDILVATPGRLLDLINQRKANLDSVDMLVLDEADTMLDMGFIKDIKSIIKRIPSKKRQTLLFSATIPNEIKELANEFMKEPILIKTKTDEVTADNICQELYYVDKNNKVSLLLDLISTKDKPSVLIFTRTKHGANNLEKKLNEFGVRVSVIHGNKTQSNRTRALKDFKTGNTKVMIATDIASRGIDINDLNLVINFDLPEKSETYVHRIGRTARAGKNGKAITLCSSTELSYLRDIERLIGKKINVIENIKYPMALSEKNTNNRTNNNRRKNQNYTQKSPKYKSEPNKKNSNYKYRKKK